MAMTFHARIGSLTITLAIAGLAASATNAQTYSQWLPGPGIAGVQGDVHAAVVWDPDGPGPQTAKLVLGGSFYASAANNLVIVDLATEQWSSLGGSPDGPVRSLVVQANGDLAVGGSFATIGNAPANNLAQWNGSTWSSIGGGVSSSTSAATVWVMATAPNGDLILGGQFDSAGPVAASGVARWNGSAWSPIGSGIQEAEGVRALAVNAAGRIFAGGFHDPANGNLLQWDGTTWSGVGGGVGGTGYDRVSAFTFLGNDLIVGGFFAMAGNTPASNLARWNGSTWSPLGAGLYGEVHGLATMPTGDVIAVGNYLSLSSWGPEENVCLWNGTSWLGIGPVQYFPPGGHGHVNCVTPLPGASLAVGGHFALAGSARARSVAHWNGTTWSRFGWEPDFAGPLLSLPNGDVIVTYHDNLVGPGLARWDGITWAPVAPALDGLVQAMLRLPNGNLVAAGSFRHAGVVRAGGIAMWDGSSWSALGTGVGPVETVCALALLPNGDIIAGGWFTTIDGQLANSIARWDGTRWHGLGTGLRGGMATVMALEVLPNGDLIAGGQFSSAGGIAAASIARWDGTTWSPLGSGFPMYQGRPEVWAMVQMPSGELVVCGYFNTAGGVPANSIASWNGTNWSSLSSPQSGVISTMALLPNGQLVVGGQFTMPDSSAHLASWDGVAWTSVGTGANGPIWRIAASRNGDLVAGGNFTMVDGSVAGQLAKRVSLYPATASSYGTGCTGSAGMNVLTADTLPWIGGTFRGEATGLPNASISVTVRGLSTTSLPLPLLQPNAPTGCMLSVAPDLLEVHVPTSGRARFAFAIPAAATLIGQRLYTQVVTGEVGSSGSLTAITSTNALSLVIGAL